MATELELYEALEVAVKAGNEVLAHLVRQEIARQMAEAENPPIGPARLTDYICSDVGSNTIINLINSHSESIKGMLAKNIEVDPNEIDEDVISIILTIGQGIYWDKKFHIIANGLAEAINTEFQEILEGES